MAIGSLKPGYLGILKKGDSTIRLSSFSVNPEQELQKYSHTLGLRDASQAGIYGGKGDQGFQNNPQNSIFRPGVVSYTGSLSFPATENTSSSFFEEAKTGDDFDITYYYNCDISRTFTGCKVNTYSISVSSGDVVQIDASIMALGMSESSGSSPKYRVAEKLITWDACNAELGDITTDDVASFKLDINNNCSYVYTAGINNSQNLHPKEIRCGIQEVSGEVVIYNYGREFVNLLNEVETTMALTIGGLQISLPVFFMPAKRSGEISSIMTTLSFVGVGKYWPEE